MWRVTSLLPGKFYFQFTFPSFLNLNAVLLTSRNRISNFPSNSHISKLSWREVRKLLSINCNTGFDRVDDAHDLFYRMLQFQPLPSIVDFSRLLTGVVKMKEYSFAILVYREMLFEGVPFNDWTMSIAMNCFCHLKQVDFGFAILATIYKHGFNPDVVTLTTLLRGLFEADRIAEAMELFQTIVFHKICDVNAYATLINGLCKSGNSSIATELLRLVPVDEYTMSIAINCFCHLNQVDLGFAILATIYKLGFKLDVVTLTTLVRGLFETGRIEEAMKLFQIMVLQNVCDGTTYGTVMNGLCKSGNASRAIEMLWCLPVDEYTMNIAINCFCHLNQVDLGFAVLATIFKLGFKPDVVTLTTLVRGLFEMDRTAEAMKLFQIMVLQKVCHGTTYGTVINGLCKSGNTSSALELLRFVQKEGHHKPDTVMYSTIIDSLCKDMMVDEALQLLSEMAANGTPGNIITYTSVIQGLCSYGRWDLVISLMTEIENMGIIPNTVTFNILVDAFSKKGCIEEAEVILKTMVKRGERPNVVTYSALMYGYCLKGEMNRAHQVLQFMVDQGCQPNIHSYSILLNGHCKRGSLDDALNLFKAISSKGIRSNVVTFNTLIKGLFDAGRCDDAKKLISKMQCKGVSPDSFTYCIWVDGLCKNGFVSEAHRFLFQMENNGAPLNIAAYTAVIDGLCEERKLSSAVNLFNRLPYLGLEPNNRTFNAMIKGFCHKGLLEDARELLIKMRECGCLADKFTCNTIVRCLLKNRHGFGAKLLFEEMLNQGVKLDSYTYSLLADSVLLQKPSMRSGRLKGNSRFHPLRKKSFQCF